MSILIIGLTRLIAKRALSSPWAELDENIRYDLNKHSAELARIPRVLIIALMAGEDRRFPSHGGVDFRSIMRACICNLRASGIVQGASTIEQQLVRTYTGDRRQSFRRKVREALLSTLVSETLPKDMIARLYILRGYYGWHGNGIEQVCHRFRYDLESLDLQTACSIISRLKYPEPEKPSIQRKEEIRRRTEYLMSCIQVVEERDEVPTNMRRSDIHEFPFSV